MLNFIIIANQHRPVEIITGRGNNSINKKPVLKPMVERHIHEDNG